MILFITTFLTVFLLAFQQKNVHGGHYKTAIITSWGIALNQFFLYKGAAEAEWYGWIYMALGGSLGVVLAMWSHGRVFK